MSSQRPISCFLLGYNGAGNTGSDVRLLTIIDDVRHAFGNAATITVATLNRDKTLRLIPESDRLRVVQLPHVFPRKVAELARSHDVTFLVEGSTFKQNWSSALLYGYLWAAWCARRAGKKCVAYAVDVGSLGFWNRLLTRRVCNNIDLLITRTAAARQRLLDMGVTTPIAANTDTAFQYLAEAPLRPPARRKKVGLAPVEFYQWPVKLRLIGRRSSCYRWPFYFTWNRQRRARSERLIDSFQRLVEHCIEQHDLDVSLIAMEELDTPLCEKIRARLPASLQQRIELISARAATPGQVVPLLRSLDYLVTSRYHASVLSLRTAVPQMALAHDERLQEIYAELGIDRAFLLDYQDPDLADKLIPMFDRLVRTAPELTELLQRQHDLYFLPRCEQNRTDLSAWARRHFPLSQERAMAS